MRAAEQPMHYTYRPMTPDNYVICCEGREIGHLCFQGRWLWTIYNNRFVAKIEDVPISGSAVTRDEAATAFKRSYEAMRAPLMKRLDDFDLPPGPRRTFRSTHCWRCKRTVDSLTCLRCEKCRWLKCRCGACGCQHVAGAA